MKQAERSARRQHAAVTIALVFLLMSFGFSEAHAQEATSFEQLKLLVKPGDTVTVRESSGQITKGKIAAMTGSSLRLVSGSGIRDMADRDVVEVRQRRGDSLGNGAINGAIAGAAFGTLSAFLGDCLSDPCAGERVAVIGVVTGLGAGIGVGIDALIIKTKVVYRGPLRESNIRLNITPVMDKQRKGIAVSMRF
jgi:hypothetical protein